MKKETHSDFLDKIEEADFIETLRLGDRNCITALVGCELPILHKLAKKIAEAASFQGGKTILLVDGLNDGDEDFIEEKPDNLEVIDCGYDDFTGFIAAMARIATTNEDVIIVSDATPCFRSEDMYNPIKSYGQCCNQFRVEANRLGKNVKLILIGYGNPNELSSYESVWFDNIMDIRGTKYPEFYYLKDRKSNHHPLRDAMVGFSIQNDLDSIQFFKEKKKKE